MIIRLPFLCTDKLLGKYRLFIGEGFRLLIITWLLISTLWSATFEGISYSSGILKTDSSIIDSLHCQLCNLDFNEKYHLQLKGVISMITIRISKVTHLLKMMTPVPSMSSDIKSHVSLITWICRSVSFSLICVSRTSFHEELVHPMMPCHTALILVHCGWPSASSGCICRQLGCDRWGRQQRLPVDGTLSSAPLNVITRIACWQRNPKKRRCGFSD